MFCVCSGGEASRLISSENLWVFFSCRRTVTLSLGIFSFALSMADTVNSSNASSPTMLCSLWQPVTGHNLDDIIRQITISWDESQKPLLRVEEKALKDESRESAAAAQEISKGATYSTSIHLNGKKRKRRQEVHWRFWSAAIDCFPIALCLFAVNLFSNKNKDNKDKIFCLIKYILFTLKRKDQNNTCKMIHPRPVRVSCFLSEPELLTVVLYLSCC